MIQISPPLDLKIFQRFPYLEVYTLKYVQLIQMSEFDSKLTLLKLRQKAGLTQQSLAAAIGVTQKTISVWEKGDVEPKISFRQTKILIEVLNCTLDDLVEATQNRS